MWDKVTVTVCRTAADESDEVSFYKDGLLACIDTFDTGEVILLLSNRRDKTVPTWCEDVSLWTPKAIMDKIKQFINQYQNSNNNDQPKETD